MQIPSNLPDLNVSQGSRRDTSVVTPAVAVPGVPEITHSLDSRVALQWAQPILTAEQAPQAKNATETWVQPPKRLPEAETVLDWDAPVAEGPYVAKLVRWLSSLAASQGGHPVPWPFVPGLDGDSLGSVRKEGFYAAPNLESPRLSQLLGRMAQLYSALVQSPIFSAHRLAQELYKNQGGKEALELEPLLAGDGVSVADDPAGFWSQSMQALAADSQHAQLAAQCLTNGTMIWSGQLMQGWMAVIRRNDEWREDPLRPGELQKGISLMLQTELPHLGRLKILAQQWVDERVVTVYVQPKKGGPLLAQAGEIQTRLQALGIQISRLEALEL